MDLVLFRLMVTDGTACQGSFPAGTVMDVLLSELRFQLLADERDSLVQDAQSPVLLIQTFLLILQLFCKLHILMYPVMTGSA